MHVDGRAASSFPLDGQLDDAPARGRRDRGEATDQLFVPRHVDVEIDPLARVEGEFLGAQVQEEGLDGGRHLPDVGHAGDEVHGNGQ